MYSPINIAVEETLKLLEKDEDVVPFKIKSDHSDSEEEAMKPIMKIDLTVKDEPVDLSVNRGLERTCSHSGENLLRPNNCISVSVLDQNQTEQQQDKSLVKISKTIEKGESKRKVGRPRSMATTVCSICNKDCKRREALKYHMSHHTGVKTHICTICGVGFNGLSNLTKHTLTHTGEMPYQCPKCFQRFRFNGNMKRHMVTHSDQKQFSCSICNKVFKTKQAVKTHEFTHTGKKPFSCPLCDYRCNRSTNIKKHVIVHHTPSMERERSHLCTECGMQFMWPSDLKRHKKVHDTDRPFSCHYCSKTFRWKRCMDDHQKTHTNERPFECHVCGRKFKLHPTMKNHLMKIHGVDIRKSASSSRINNYNNN